MKKIYIALGIGLVVLVLILTVISLLGKSKTTSKSEVIPTPTLNSISAENNTVQTTSDIQNILPVETADFSFSYSSYS